MVNVLVVDDERDFADILSQRLQARGLDVRVAYSGQEALDQTRHIPPDVVVLDVTMPGISGLDTLEELKRISPRTEIILLTADSTVGTAVSGMKLGAGDYLIKPADIDTLVAAIGEAETRRMDGLSRQRMAETAKLAALGELATGVAHEINNPLHVMVNEVGWIGELLEEAGIEKKLGEEIRQALHLIRHQAQRCKAITSKLLTLRPVRNSRASLTTLPSLVRVILDRRRDRIDGLGVTTHEAWGSDLGHVPVPESEWEQILANVIDNALDAMEQGGGNLRLLGETQGHELVVSVGDSGCGIEAHLLTRIFEPFFSTKDVGKGIGLGLAICHSIIESMGGTISVRSSPGNGSTFTIRVPVAMHAQNEHTRPEHPASSKEE
ncbi:MAG: response regulator [Desulfovibrionales bacterium]|nr:response regulator [Desulfovibrionales bacterium]